jgi:hypothetical protein
MKVGRGSSPGTLHSCDPSGFENQKYHKTRFGIKSEKSERR